MSLKKESMLVAWLVLICRASIAIVAISWFVSSDMLKFTVAIVSLALTFLPSQIIARPVIANAALLVTGALLAAHIVFGMYFELYEVSAWYDKVMHVIGSAAIAYVLFVAVNTYSRHWQLNMPLLVIPVLVVISTLSAGTLWEFFEYGIDATGLFQAQRGLDDTMQDLLADAIGAVIAAMILIIDSVFKSPVERGKWPFLGRLNRGRH